MADTKTKNENAETENVKAETENEKAETKPETKARAKKATAVASGDELVDYFAPMLPGENRQDIFVAVNGESLVIKRGVNVKIKRKFYEVLQNAQAQEMAAFKAMEAAKKQGEKALTNM